MKKAEVIEMINTWENLNFYIQQLSHHPEHLLPILEVAFDDSKQENWRAAYLIDKLADVNPELIRPYLGSFVNALKTTQNNSKRRHYLKLLSQYPIQTEHIDFLFNHCLDLFTTDKCPIAVRVHAMQILFEISEIEIGLKPELVQIIENEIDLHPSAGIKSRGRKILQKLQLFNHNHSVIG